MTILLLTIVGAIISAVVGTFWYSDSTPMGKIHMRYLGFDKLTEEQRKKIMEEAKPMMPKQYAGQLTLSLLTSFAVVYIITLSIQNGVPLVMALGFIVLNWLCFMVPIVGSNVIWGNTDRKIVWQKFFSDIANNLATVILIGLMASMFA